jgi:hypothetical protein
LKVRLQLPSLLELTVNLQLEVLVLPEEPSLVQACLWGAQGVLVAMGEGCVHLEPRQFRTFVQSVAQGEQHASPLPALFRLDLAELLRVSLDHVQEKTRLPLTVHRIDQAQFPKTMQLKRLLPTARQVLQGMVDRPLVAHSKFSTRESLATRQ